MDFDKHALSTLTMLPCTWGEFDDGNVQGIVLYIPGNFEVRICTIAGNTPARWLDLCSAQVVDTALEDKNPREYYQQWNADYIKADPEGRAELAVFGVPLLECLVFAINTFNRQWTNTFKVPR